MRIRDLGAIDCDLHPAVPHTDLLLPYLDEYWREMVEMRTVRNLDLASYAPSWPIAGRPDWRPTQGKPGADFETLQRQALDAFGTRYAICNPLYGVSAMANDDFTAILCRATNDWIAKEWLDRDPRLRASILIPTESTELAVEEIERRAVDKRFVQVMVLLMGEETLGRRKYWPIYEAAARHGLPLGIHLGSAYRHAPSSIGWKSYMFEEYVDATQGFAAQLLSLLTEGVFAHVPDLKVVLLESGVTWLAPFLWRLDKTWRGIRYEVPWLDGRPSDIVKRSVRLSLQPFDEPPEAAMIERVVDQLDSDDLLLFSTDYPHWHYDTDEEVLPAALSDTLVRKIAVDNPLATYTRLQGGKA